MQRVPGVRGRPNPPPPIVEVAEENNWAAVSFDQACCEMHRFGCRGWQETRPIRFRRGMATRVAADRTSFNQPANTHVSLFDASLPGTLPKLNPECVAAALRTVSLLGCTLDRHSRFDRKHYFYQDLPLGYQITQQYRPIGRGGEVVLGEFSSKSKTARAGDVVRINHIRLEQDTGKTIHVPGGGNLVDLNRAGTGLLEIVSEPDMRSAEDAVDYLQQLQFLLSYGGVVDPLASDASVLRCDVNVSLRVRGASSLGQRCELKNINQLGEIQKAIKYEIGRQAALLEGGESVAQETRTWDSELKQTVLLRKKEDAVDYRYFPDPDIPILHITEEFEAAVARASPEHPLVRKRRFAEEYALSTDQTYIAVREPAVGALLEKVLALRNKSNRRNDARWITVDFLGVLRTHNKTLLDHGVSAKQLASLLNELDGQNITEKIGKRILHVMVQDGDLRLAGEIAAANGWCGASVDREAIRQVCREVFEEFPEKLDLYRKGDRPSLKNLFMGQVIRRFKGKVDAADVRRELEMCLGEREEQS